MVLIAICRYLQEDELEGVSTVYMAPNVKEFLSIAAWSFAKSINMVLQPIPNCIYTRLEDAQLKIFDKLRPAFEKMTHDKLVVHFTARFYFIASSLLLTHVQINPNLITTHIRSMG